MQAALRLLLVDGDPAALKQHAGTLTIAGYRVDAATDGEAALERAAHARYDLIATELDLPRRDGLALLAALRAHEAGEGLEATPWLALTTGAHEAQRAQALSLGARAVLDKPVRSRELVTTVRAHVDDRTAVLVVDDAEPSRELVCTWLRRLPRVRVLGVDRAGAAIACVKRERVDVVLLDMVMPGIDGYAAARLLRAVPGAEALPIVALTARVGEEERLACLAAGCSDYLAKPVDRARLFERLEPHLRLERTATSVRPARASAVPAAVHAACADPSALEDECAALVPAFLEKRNAELAVLEAALATRAFDTLYRLGHNLRGSGGSFGFPAMSEIGARMERAAQAGDEAAMAREIACLREHLREVMQARSAQPSLRR